MVLPGPGADDDLLMELAEELRGLAAAVREGLPDARERRFRLVEGLVQRGWLLDLAFWLYRRPPLEEREIELLKRVVAEQAKERNLRDAFEAEVERRRGRDL